MENVTLNTYNGTFQAPVQWLENYLEGMALDAFLDSYTWDDGEWLYIQLSIEREEKQIKQLTQKLREGFSLFKKDYQEGVLHACTSGNYIYQFSYFDEHGAIGDIQKNTLEEMAKSIYNYGFTPCTKDSLKIIK